MKEPSTLGLLLQFVGLSLAAKNALAKDGITATESVVWRVKEIRSPRTSESVSARELPSGMAVSKPVENR